MIEGLKPYAEYKNMGQDWLGELPAHWGLRRAKYLFHEVDERSQTGKEELMSVSHITGVTPRSQKTVTMFLAESNVGYKVCRPNDVVINTLWAWMAALGVARQTGIVSPAYGVYRPLATDCFLPRYSDLLLRTPAYAAEYLRRSTGVNSSRLRLYPEQFLRIPLIYPPTDEQAAIVRFLDHANRKIDHFIRSKRRLIGLLNEQKQVIINHAVTKGLDPDVPMKDSGVEWLGMVPEEWIILPLKFIIRIRSGEAPPQERSKIGGEYPIYGANGIIGYCPHYNSVEKCILIGRVGSVGEVHIAPPKVWISDNVLIAEPNNSKLFLEFAFYLMKSVDLKIDATKNAQPLITGSQVKNRIIIMPKLNEQRAIASFLDRKTAKLDTLIAYNRDVIGKLREFRTHLIFEVVTGKLDVRGVELPAMEEAEALEVIDTSEDIETEAEDLIESEEVTDADE